MLLEGADMTVEELIKKLNTLSPKQKILPIFFFTGNEDFAEATCINIVDYIDNVKKAVIFTNWEM
jgi:hypothetical protein